MVAHEGHETPASSMDGMSGSTSSSHTGMTMAFFTSTETPLYSLSWAPQNAGQYAGTCIFLIVLAIFLRAIYTAKTFLEMRALESALKRRYIVVAGEKSVAEQAMNDGSSTTGILTSNGVQEDVRIVSAPVKHIQPWRFGVDLPRSLLTAVAVAVGYLSMLAVMTFNVGYFLSVVAGSFVGELAFGRFNQGAMGM
ncbi:Ctr copper transporter-like protein [Plenodomus tracheiphilus IPT5]|uniref:Copper transport protein n=1 Tax=Plenodomus tracheiphilus IPT5 TaxID=1408161 RepID=A0A6A7AZV9_9PLEO|nr:Ctr copper transporter-like protein [Plenodomus tracheiphilus IPT5]